MRNVHVPDPVLVFLTSGEKKRLDVGRQYVLRVRPSVVGGDGVRLPVHGMYQTGTNLVGPLLQTRPRVLVQTDTLSLKV